MGLRMVGMSELVIKEGRGLVNIKLDVEQTPW